MSDSQTDFTKAKLVIANQWIKFNSHKNPVTDPWKIKDNFRVNNVAVEKVVLKSNADDETEALFVESLPNNTFSVHKGEEMDGSKEYIFENVHVLECPEDDKQLII